MGTSKITPPAGLHPDSLPPDFEAWDEPVPTHPSGQVTAYDEQSGLPIVRRKAPGNTPETASKPAAKPEAETKPTKPETPEPKAETKPDKAPLQKGSPVQLPDGTRGKVAHVIQGMGTVRVRTDDGRNLTVRAKALTVVPHVMVTAHARRIPGG